MGVGLLAIIPTTKRIIFRINPSLNTQPIKAGTTEYSDFHLWLSENPSQKSYWVWD
jgi:hypothetical protein